jgi:hypothetical protein
LIVEYFRNLSFAGAVPQQPSQGSQQQTVNIPASVPAAVGQNTTGSERNVHAAQVPTDQGSQNSSSSTAGNKFKRGERHIDVSASRDHHVGRQRMRERGNGAINVETVVSAAEETYLSPAAYSQTGTEERGGGTPGNVFFPAADGLDV